MRSPAVSHKYMIQPKGSKMTWLCGLYRIEEGLPVFVILTREPGEEIRFIHDRMPLILTSEEAALWVKDVSEAESILTKVLPQLRAERPYEQLTFDW